MATAATDPRLAIGANDPPAEAKLSIAELVAQSPAIVLTDEEKRAELFAHIEGEIAAFAPDIETVKGREAIKSFAFRFTKTKTAIDNAGKAMNEAARAQINVVDAARRVTKQRLEELTDKAREPLTAWEEAELARNNRADEIIHRLHALAVVSPFDTADDVRKQGTEAYETVLSADELGDRLDDVQRAKDEAVASLKESLARVLKDEADKAELEKLRQEKADAEAREAELRATQEAAEAKRKYARDIIEHINQCGLGMIGGKTYPYGVLLRELEEKIVVTEAEFGDMAADVEKVRVDTLVRLNDAMKQQAERDRKEAAEQAARDAREEESRKAEAEKEERSRKHAEELAAAESRAEEAEAAAQVERDRIAAADAERQRIAAEEAAEQKRRDEDRAHRGKVMGAAKSAMMTCGADEETAKKIVLAIIAGEVPAVSLRF